ncbi:serine/threonine-protein kinase PknD, partial [Mycobacterium sp. 852002-51163_SCH5372311]|uniref:serine/threonine-protein kinase PknD n=1 Tax=Mycobacterium sp. 852002-51163_SCH5372311 TaxID=1834097 RepID=UPI000A7D48B8
HAAARLNSPHVIPIHHYGEIDGRLYVDMRLIEGRDLQTVLADGPLEPARAVRIIEQVGKALHAAHEVGLLHRDIKPSNILLDRDDFAYLIDFGIARALDETRMTKSGHMIGTFQYIAPERLDNRTEDARADIYSLACVLYECLTGHPPFDGDTMARLVAAHLSAPPPRPSITRPDVPTPVDEVIATGMAKDPDQRYATTVELADAARDAITVPIARPAVNPTRVRSTEPASHPVTALPATVRAEPPVPAGSAVPQQPAPPVPTTAGRMSRRTTLTLIGGGAVAAIAAAVGIPTLTKNRPSQSPPRTSSLRTYGPQVVLPFTGLKGPYDVAVDSAGNVYVADGHNKRVLKLAAESSTQTVLPFTDLSNAIESVAVDSGGNVYVADPSGARVLKLAAGSSTQEGLPFTGLKEPNGLAVDNAGTLYVTDWNTKRVVKLAAGSSTQEMLPFTGLYPPTGVAVDGVGAVYVTDGSNRRVVKLAAGSSTQEVLLAGLDWPHDVAVDSAGTLYVTVGDGSNQVLRLAAGSSTQEVLPVTGLRDPRGVAVDGTGNLYITDHDSNQVLKLPVE